MSENKYVDYGNLQCSIPSTNESITGARFTLAPMSDKFIDIILGAIEKVDTSKVWKATDMLSTIYRGKRIHVMDCLKSCFIQSYKANVHMTMEATISKGCPGDSDADCFLSEDDILTNENLSSKINFPVICKISLYPMGVSNYMQYIANVVNKAIDMKIYAGSAHYVTFLEGDIHKIFEYLNTSLAYCEENIGHYILQVTFSVNSPSTCKIKVEENNEN